MMFKMQLTENKMIGITFVLVVLMAFPTYQTLAQNDELASSSTVTSLAETSVREPASIPAKALNVEKPNPHFKTLDLNCAKKPANAVVSVSGAFVQFQGKNCLPNFKDGDVEIINKSNGFTASIFPRGADKYQTDLIQLQHGENEITIRYREGSGKPIEETIRITSASI